MSSLTDYLDKGASLGRDAPCLVEGDRTLSYADVQDLSHRVAGALARDGVEPGAKVGIRRRTCGRSWCRDATAPGMDDTRGSSRCRRSAAGLRRRILRRGPPALSHHEECTMADDVQRNLDAMDELDFVGWNNADWNGVFAHHHTDDVHVDWRGQPPTEHPGPHRRHEGVRGGRG